MLPDSALRDLNPKSLTCKDSDWDGMCESVSPVGTAAFRYDCRLNGRQETLTIGRYGKAGISLASEREKLGDAKKAGAQVKSPAHEKQREHRRLTAASTSAE